MHKLTPRQKEVFDRIRESVVIRGYAPTYREIANAMGWRSTNHAHAVVDALVRRGYLARCPGIPRAMTLMAVAEFPAFVAKAGKAIKFIDCATQRVGRALWHAVVPPLMPALEAA